MLVGVPGSPTLTRGVDAGDLDCPWRHTRVGLDVCRRCVRLVALEYRHGRFVVHCQCPQSDAVNDPAWHDAV